MQTQVEVQLYSIWEIRGRTEDIGDSRKEQEWRGEVEWSRNREVISFDTESDKSTREKGKEKAQDHVLVKQVRQGRTKVVYFLEEASKLLL